MLYGERLKLAMEHRSSQLGRKISQSELARVVGCSSQNISMILSHARGDDHKLSTAHHLRAAVFLKVSSRWLADGSAEMTPTSFGDEFQSLEDEIYAIQQSDKPTSTVPDYAKQIGILFNGLPVEVRLEAFNAVIPILLAFLPAQTESKTHALPQSDAVDKQTV